MGNAGRPVPCVANIMQVIFNMDRMVGRDFETGLANMKAIAEKCEFEEETRGQSSRQIAS